MAVFVKFRLRGNMVKLWVGGLFGPKKVHFNRGGVGHFQQRHWRSSRVATPRV